MSKTLSVALPNGKRCYFTSPAMGLVAKFLRWETFKREQYHRPGFELRSDDTVVDIGANVGMFALWAAPQLMHGRLICIEPNPTALENLSMNIHKNDMDNVIVVPAAAGSADGTLELICHPGFEALTHNAAVDAPWIFAQTRSGRVVRWLLQSSFGYTRQPAATQTIVVRQRPLSHIMDERGVAAINFLKIDCEGSEYEVLRSLDAANWAKIERVVIEYHDFGQSRDHRELMQILSNHGFEVEVAHTLLDRLFRLIGIRVGKIWAKKPSTSQTGQHRAAHFPARLATDAT